MTALPRSRLSPITFDGTPTVPARHTTTPVVPERLLGHHRRRWNGSGGPTEAACP
ncbi:hypothetical protein GS506_00490 [Rhodococcus hoagii]|nr:hypothetical protein [Prescottella equi]